MSSPRNHSNHDKKRRHIDNLERVADGMLSYVTRMTNTLELVSLVKDVGSEYKLPRESWVWGWLYMFTRVRGPEINKLAATLNNQCGSPGTLLRGLLSFLSEGGWTSTSANTTLIYMLVGKLPGYNESARKDLTAKNVRRLAKLFIIKSEAALAASVITYKKLNAKDGFTIAKKKQLAKELEKLGETNNVEQKNKTLSGLFKADHAAIARNKLFAERANSAKPVKLEEGFKKNLISILGGQLQNQHTHAIARKNAIEHKLKEYAGIPVGEQSKQQEEVAKKIDLNEFSEVTARLDVMFSSLAASAKKEKVSDTKFCAASGVDESIEDSDETPKKNVRMECTSAELSSIMRMYPDVRIDEQSDEKFDAPAERFNESAEIKKLELNPRLRNARANLARLFGASSINKLEGKRNDAEDVVNNNNLSMQK